MQREDRKKREGQKILLVEDDWELGEGITWMLEKEGFLYTIPAKGCYVAPKNVELLREESLKKIEDHIDQILKLGASCNLSKDDIVSMILFAMEGQE